MRIINTFYYLTLAGIFFALKLGYVYCNDQDLYFLLKPTDALIGLITNSFSEFIPEQGFFHPDLNMIINKSCSGFNFLILCFLMLTVLFLQFSVTPSQKAAAFPLALLTAYMVTIFANTSRIATALFLRPYTTRFYHWESVLHQAEGAFVYLAFLTAIYLISHTILSKFSLTHNEKPA